MTIVVSILISVFAWTAVVQLSQYVAAVLKAGSIILTIILLLYLSHIRIEILDETPTEPACLKSRLMVLGILPSPIATEEVKGIKRLSLDVDQFRSYRSVKATEIPVLQIQYDTIMENRSKNQKLIEKRSRGILVAPYNILHQVAVFISEKLSIEIQLNLLDNPQLVNSILEDSNEEDPENELVFGFAGTVLVDGNMSKKVRFDDRDRWFASFIVIIFLIMVFVRYANNNLGFGPPSSDTEAMGIDVVMTLTFVFTLWHILRGYRRTIVQINPGMILLGWELFGLEYTKETSAGEVDTILFSKPINGRRKLILLGERNLYLAGSIPLDRKKERLQLSYLRHHLHRVQQYQSYPDSDKLIPK